MYANIRTNGLKGMVMSRKNNPHSKRIRFDNAIFNERHLVNDGIFRTGECTSPGHYSQQGHDILDTFSQHESSV